MGCPCTHEPINNVNLHIFSECSHTEIVFDQLALSQFLDELLHQCDLNHLSQVSRIQILLGKFTPELHKENMDGVFLLAAKMCYKAFEIMSK